MTGQYIVAEIIAQDKIEGADRNMMVDHWRSQGLLCYQVYYGDF